MLKVYDVKTPFNATQTHVVVAESMCEAERLYKAKYPHTRIEQIRLVSEYVIVRGSEEKP